MMKIKRLDKLPKRRVTVDDLLELSDIQDTIDAVLADKGTIVELLIVWTVEGEMKQAWCNLSSNRKLWLLERIRHDLMKEADNAS